MSKPEMPDATRQEFLDHDYLSAPQLRRVLGAKGEGRMLSEHGLQALVRNGVLPPPLMLGKYRRWRWGAVRQALAKLETVKERQ